MGSRMAAVAYNVDFCQFWQRRAAPRALHLEVHIEEGMQVFIWGLVRCWFGLHGLRGFRYILLFRIGGAFAALIPSLFGDLPWHCRLPASDCGYEGRKAFLSTQLQFRYGLIWGVYRLRIFSANDRLSVRQTNLLRFIDWLVAVYLLLAWSRLLAGRIHEVGNRILRLKRSMML